MGWGILLLEKDTLFELCWRCFAVFLLLYNITPAYNSAVNFFLLSLKIGECDHFNTYRSKGELSIEELLNSMAMGDVLRDVLFINAMHKRKSL
jgi:hypothetical protein